MAFYASKGTEQINPLPIQLKMETSSNRMKFEPPCSDSDCTPDTLFTPGVPPGSRLPAPRWLRRTNNRECLIFTDGACINNGSENASAGCAVVYRPETSREFISRANKQKLDLSRLSLHKLGEISFKMEDEGPYGLDEQKVTKHTSNRAELRAVIAALQFRDWVGDGIERLVIATDSEYVAIGAIKWVHCWKHNKWRTSRKTPVKNKDLWACLLEELTHWSEEGLEVQFWRVPRHLNSIADHFANRAAREPAQPKYTTILGAAC